MGARDAAIPSPAPPPAPWVIALAEVDAVALVAVASFAPVAAVTWIAFGAAWLLATCGVALLQKRRAMLRVASAQGGRALLSLMRLSRLAALRPPRLEVTAEAIPRAWSTRFAGRGVVGCTTGLLDALDGRELDAVLAHEMAHHRHRDGLRQAPAALLELGAVMFAVVAVAGALARGSLTVALLAVANVAVWGARLLRTAQTRRLELHADRAAVDLTGDPAGMLRALRRLGDVEARAARRRVRGPTALLDRLLRSHPPIEERLGAVLAWQPVAVAPAATVALRGMRAPTAAAAMRAPAPPPPRGPRIDRGLQ